MRGRRVKGEKCDPRWDGGLCFCSSRPVISNQLSLTDRGGKFLCANAAAIQKGPLRPAGSLRDEGGLSGTQVERDEENQTGTLWTVTPSLSPFINSSLSFCFQRTNVMYSVFSGWSGGSGRKWWRLYLRVTSVSGQNRQFYQSISLMNVQPFCPWVNLKA